MIRLRWLKWLFPALLLVPVIYIIIIKTGLFSEKKGSEINEYNAPRALNSPVVDGNGDDSCWEKAPWKDIKYLWAGSSLSPEDFGGRYKIVWTPEKLYYLIEINDYQLNDTHPYPYDNYFNDDGLELFLDEDHSGGWCKNIYNAFKYYISIDNFVASLGPTYVPLCFNNHMDIKRVDVGSLHTWEIGLKVYSDDYSSAKTNNVPVRLAAGKVLGYALAYNDYDDGLLQHYIGSYDRSVPEGYKLDPSVNADGYGALKLLP